MQKSYSIQLELYAGGTKSTGINYVVADQETMPLYIDLLAYGKPFAIPQNAGIEMNYENPKGGTFPAMGEIVDRENGRILYEINGGDIAIDGGMTGSVTIVSGGQRLTWQMFRFYVTRSLAGGETPPDAALPWFSQVMSEISFIKQRLDEVEAGGGGSGEGGTTLHNKLQNLSYALSGHTGFASAEQIDVINAEIVNINSRLDVLVSNDSALADEIIALSEAISNIQLTPGPQGEPGKDGKDGKDGAQGIQGLQGIQGADGISPTITVAEQTSTTYKLNVTDKNGTFTTPNLQGQDGSNGSGGSTPIVDNLTSTSATSALSANQGRVLNTSKEPVISTKNTAFNKNFGTAAGTVCEGNDGRLSDSRTPKQHTHGASDITQDSNNKFVTDAEKSKWDAAVTSEVFDDDVINIDNPDFDPADVLARITKLENTVGTLNTSLQARLEGAL